MCVLDEALRLYDAGFSVLPIKMDGSKAPDLKEWRPLKDKANVVRIPEAGLRVCFSDDYHGLAVIGGEFSGHLETLDFDNHGGRPEADVFGRFWNVVEVNIPEIAPMLVTYQTPKDGWRIAYRCPVVYEKKSFALARLPDGETIIEVLASGAVILVPGGHPSAHSLNKPYVYRQGHLAGVATITEDERRRLHNAARVYDTYEAPERVGVKPRADEDSDPEREPGRKKGPSWIKTPGDDFNERGEWGDILCPAGWEQSRCHRAATYWTRPGKGAGVSASTDYHDGFLYVFTANAEPLEKDKAYSKFSAFTLLQHGGDFRAAAELRGRGFGGLVLTEEEKARLASWDRPTRYRK